MVALIFTSITLIILSFVFLVMSFYPLNFFENIVLSLNIPKALQYIGARYKLLIISLRLASLILFISSLLLYIFKKYIIKWIDSLNKDRSTFISFLKEILTHNYISDKYYLLLLLFIFIYGIVLRFNYIHQPIRYDEATTYLLFASKPIYFGLSVYPAPNNHLFNTFLMHSFVSIFGNDPWVLRLPAFIFGSLTVIISYFLAQVYYNKFAGLLVACFVSTSSILIEYSCNGRGYTIIVFLSLVIFLFVIYLRTNKNKFAWLMFSFINALGFYTIPTMLYSYVISVFLLLVMVSKDRPVIKSILLKNIFYYSLIMLLLAIIFYLPVIIVSGVGAIINNNYVKSMPINKFIKNIGISFIDTYNQWNRDIHPILKIIISISFLLSTIYYKNISKYKINLALWVIIPTLIILIIQRVVPFARVWLFILPIYFAIAFSGIGFLIEKSKRSERIKICIIYALIIIIGTINTIYLIKNKSIIISKETGVLMEGEEIIKYIGTIINNDDVIIAKCPTDNIVKYKMLKKGLFQKVYSTYDREEIQRSDIKNGFIIVNIEYNQTLDKILEEIKLKKDNYTIKEEIRYNKAILYYFKKIKE